MRIVILKFKNLKISKTNYNHNNYLKNSNNKKFNKISKENFNSIKQLQKSESCCILLSLNKLFLKKNHFG